MSNKIFKRKIGNTTYQWRDPDATEIVAAENQLTREYLPYLQKLGPNEPLPESFMALRTFCIYSAALIEPKLSAKQIGSLSRARFTALRNQMTKDLKLDEQDDIFFLDESDGSSAGDIGGERLQDSKVGVGQNDNRGNSMASSSPALAESPVGNSIEKLRS